MAVEKRVALPLIRPPSKAQSSNCIPSQGFIDTGVREFLQAPSDARFMGKPMAHSPTIVSGATPL